jgi:hypothetical protein
LRQDLYFALPTLHYRCRVVAISGRQESDDTHAFGGPGVSVKQQNTWPWRKKK